MSTVSIWPRLVSAIAALRPAVRVKWSGDAQPTRWEPWVTIPTNSYLETGTLGPVPFREVEWVELDPARTNVQGRLVESTAQWRESLVSALSAAGVAWSEVEGKFRVTGDAA